MKECAAIMGERSAIEWTTHTFNPWWGCIRVSPGCEHCYAETFAKRTGHKVWGPAKTTDRRLFGEKHWAEPLKWNAAAEKAGERARVFCASMADVFEDHPALDAERAKLWPLIEATPWLDWQLLTKRPENVWRMIPWPGRWPRNIWLGTSVEDQRRADERIPLLVNHRNAAEVLFLSCEPLLGPVTLGRLRSMLDWVIIGGESGPGARPFEDSWARSLIEECRRAGARPFVKQLGKHVLTWGALECQGGRWPNGSRLHVGNSYSDPMRAQLRDAKGGDMAEWPEDLRVREMPSPTSSASTLTEISELG